MNENAITQLVWRSTGSLFTSPYERRSGTSTGQSSFDGQLQSSFGSFSRKVDGGVFGFAIGTVNGGFSSNNGDLDAQSVPTEAQKYHLENRSISAREFDHVNTDFGARSAPSRVVRGVNVGGGFGRSAESDEQPRNLDQSSGRAPLSSESSSPSSPMNDIRSEVNTESYSADKSSDDVDNSRAFSGEKGSNGAGDGRKGERNLSAESESGRASSINERGNKTNRSKRRGSKNASEDRLDESTGGKKVESREGSETARANGSDARSRTAAKTSGVSPAATSSTGSSGSNSATPGTNTGHIQQGPTSTGASSTPTSSGAEARNGGSEFRAVLSNSNNTESASTSSNSATSQAKAPAFMRGVLAMTHTQGGSMTMKLTPESLGPLRIQMTVNQAEISIQFHTQTSEAGALIRDSLDGLRSALESQGYRMGQVTIQPLSRTESGEGNTGGTNHQSGNQSGQHEQHDAGEGRSRGFQERPSFQGRRPLRHEQSRTEEFASRFGTNMKSNVIN